MFGQDIEKYKQQGKQAFYKWATKPRPPLKTRLWKVFKQMLLIIVISFLVVLILFLTKVKVAKAEAIHGDKPVRGWFWYEDPVKEEKKKPEQPKEQPKETEKTVKKDETKKDFEFPVLDTAPSIMKEFLKEPTEENAKEYLAWQYKYFAHLKKIGYSLRNAYLRYGGEIYPVYGYPESPMASVYFHNMKDDITKAAIAKARGKIGLIYFYSKSCPGCKHQKDTIIRLIEIHGLSARGVSIDGDIDYDLPFHSVYNPAIVQQYGITQTPTLIAVLDMNGRPKIAALSAGYTEREIIEQQLVRFLIQEGVIKEKDLNPVFLNR